MMQNIFRIIFISMMIFGLSISCTNDDDKEEECISNQTEYITSVVLPNTGNVNQTMNIEVKFGVRTYKLNGLFIFYE